MAKSKNLVSVRIIRAIGPSYAQEYIQRFGFEPEVTAKISRVPDVRIYEVGISYYGRTYEDGKKIGLKDAFRALYCIFKYTVFSKFTTKNNA